MVKRSRFRSTALHTHKPYKWLLLLGSSRYCLLRRQSLFMGSKLSKRAAAKISFRTKIKKITKTCSPSSLRQEIEEHIDSEREEESAAPVLVEKNHTLIEVSQSSMQERREVIEEDLDPHIEERIHSEREEEENHTSEIGEEENHTHIEDVEIEDDVQPEDIEERVDSEREEEENHTCEIGEEENHTHIEDVPPEDIEEDRDSQRESSVHEENHTNIELEELKDSEREHRDCEEQVIEDQEEEEGEHRDCEDQVIEDQEEEEGEHRDCEDQEEGDGTEEEEEEESDHEAEEEEDHEGEDEEENYSHQSDNEDSMSDHDDSDNESDNEDGHGGGEGRFKSLLPALTEESDPSTQLVALTELCESLSFEEGSVSARDTEIIAPVLVALANYEGNADIMLLAVRAITYLCDISPKTSTRLLVQNSAVDMLCGRLMNIEYLDVAEQCIQALEKISRVSPGPCLQAGAIMALLSFIDFFSLGVQRVALSTVANICMELQSDYSSQFMEAVPTLCNLLNYEDQKVVETVTISLTRIVNNVYSSTEMVDELCKHGLIHQVMRLIAPNKGTTLIPPIHTGLIGILPRLTSGSLTAVKSLFELNIGSSVKLILSSYDHSRVNGDVYPNQIQEVFKLLDVLLPPFPINSGDNPMASEKEKFVQDQPELLQQFGKNLLPALIQVVKSGANLNVCHGCLSIINRILYFSRSDMLPDLLCESSISSFLAGVFSQKDRHVLVLALSIVKTILHEVPNVFLEAFIKEGVVYAIDAILATEKCSPQPSSSSNEEVSTVEDHRCFCYAYDIEPASSGTRACKLGDTSVQILAEAIKTTYLSRESSSSRLGVTEALQKLRSLSGELSDGVDTCTKNNGCAEDEERLSHILAKILAELNGRECLSTFEVIESGIVKSLVNYLTDGQYQDRKMNPHGLSHRWDIVLKRFEVFARFSLSSGTQHWEDTPLAILVKILQSAISSLENFPVILNNSFKPRKTYATVQSRPRKKSPCLNVHFTLEEGETTLRDHDSEVETVGVSTSVGALENFLWPKVSKNKEETDSSHSSSEENEEEECLTFSADGDSENLTLFLDGRPLNQKFSFYQAILQLRVNAENDANLGADFWNEVYEITYKKSSYLEKSNSQEILQESHLLIKKDYPLWQNILCPLVAEFPHELKSSRIYETLILLKILEIINKYAFQLISHERSKVFSEGRNNGMDNLIVNGMDNLIVTVSKVPETKFVSVKLTEKLEQQMQDILATSADRMPYWCGQLMSTFPFLFSFDARSKYFRLTAVQVPPSSLPHTKFIVSREHIMDSATEMMDNHASSKAILEVEYDQEVGIGLGPTIEFYTVVSREFQRVGLGMWRDDPGHLTSGESSQVEDSGHVVSPSGLFPRPWSTELSPESTILFSEMIKKFTLLGQVVGRAFKDGRVLDLPLSKSFYKLVLDQGLNIYDIQSIDSGLVKVLLEFQGLADGKKISDSVFGNCTASISNSYLRNTSIEDLYIDFSLPGYPDYQFTSVHGHKMVNMKNMEEYVSLVVDATVNSGISRQVEAFKSGFGQVLQIKSLQIFTEEELEHLLCGEPSAWDPNELLDHIKFDHGYTARSPPIINLIEILQEFEREHQQAFLQFVTGAPRLPIGGLAALMPKLTVVCKNSDEQADAELPSVMTCANYLKLPPYSSKELMREKLLYAMTEGQGSFHLS